MSDRVCSHSKAFKTRCIECEAVASARDNLNQYSKLVVKLEAEQRLSSS
jgi:hypothetical protein